MRAIQDACGCHCGTSLAFVPRGPLSGVTQLSADLLKLTVGGVPSWAGGVQSSSSVQVCTDWILKRGGRCKEPRRGTVRTRWTRERWALASGEFPALGDPFLPQVRAAPDDQL